MSELDILTRIGYYSRMKLVPKTHKGRNKIAEAGTDEWRIVKCSDSVVCFNGRPGILIEPANGNPFLKQRWILADNDPDFFVATIVPCRSRFSIWCTNEAISPNEVCDECIRKAEDWA